MPWAAAGLLALVVPFVVHRLSRRPPDIERFPTLRLLEAAPLRPTQRARLDDRRLLLLRCAMLAVVVAGLMQPLRNARPSADRTSNTTPSTVILVDTSSQASAPDARDTVDRPAMRRLVSADQLRDELQAAVSWLRTRPAPRVIELWSDVPAWALDSVDLASLPIDVSLQLVLQPPSMPAQSTSRAATMPDTLHWFPSDSREAWRNALAARQHVLDAWPLSRVRHAAPVAANGDALPLLFNQRGAAVVAAQYSPPTLSLLANPAWPYTAADTSLAAVWLPLRDALSPLARARFAQRSAPLRGVYHAPDALIRWAAVASGPALGPSTSTDLHQQDTLARWFWGAALMLLALEQWLRSRPRT